MASQGVKTNRGMLLTFNSMTRTSGTSDDWLVQFDSPCHVDQLAQRQPTRDNPVCLKLKSVYYADTFSNVDTSNDKIDFIENGGSVMTLYISHGYYTGIQYLNTVAGAMSSASQVGNIYNATLDGNTGQVSFTSISPVATKTSSGIAFQFLFASGPSAASSSAWRMLGFANPDGSNTPIDTIMATSCVAYAPLNVYRPVAALLNVYVNYKKIITCYDPAGNSYSSLILPRLALQGDISYYSDTAGMEQILPLPGDLAVISSMRFEIVDFRGKPLSLNGSDWSICFLAV